jgi:nicotinamidase/pyrazinamidase
MKERVMSEMIVLGATDALVVVDMQNDFCEPDGALYVAGVPGEATMEVVITNTLALLDKPSGYRIATFDEHLPGHIEFSIYGPHVLRGTRGAEHVDMLLPEEESFDALMYKGENLSVVSYSIATSRRFADMLVCMRGRGIKRVFLCGVAYTHCVGESAMAFAAQIFDTYVVRDATRSVPPPYGNPKAMKARLKLAGVKEITMADIA